MKLFPYLIIILSFLLLFYILNKNNNTSKYPLFVILLIVLGILVYIVLVIFLLKNIAYLISNESLDDSNLPKFEVKKTKYDNYSTLSTNNKLDNITKNWFTLATGALALSFVKFSGLILDMFGATTGIKRGIVAVSFYIIGVINLIIKRINELYLSNYINKITISYNDENLNNLSGTSLDMYIGSIEPKYILQICIIYLGFCIIILYFIPTILQNISFFDFVSKNISEKFFFSPLYYDNIKITKPDIIYIYISCIFIVLGFISYFCLHNIEMIVLLLLENSN